MQPQPSATAGGLFFGLFIGKPPYNCKQSLPSLCHSVGPSAGQNVQSEQTPVLTFSTARNARSRCRFSPEERLFVAPVERNGNFGPSAGQNVQSEQTPVLTFSTARNARSRCRFSPEERLFVAPVERNGNFARPAPPHHSLMGTKLKGPDPQGIRGLLSHSGSREAAARRVIRRRSARPG